MLSAHCETESILATATATAAAAAAAAAPRSAVL
jgi:hypothetical protein